MDQRGNFRVRKLSADKIYVGKFPRGNFPAGKLSFENFSGGATPSLLIVLAGEPA